MSKSKNPFKMCFVTIPAIPEYKLKERKVRVYVDLNTGNTYGSDHITKRLHHKDKAVKQFTADSVENQVHFELANKLKNVNPRLNGSIVREVQPDTVFDKNNGKGSKLKFVLFDNV